MSFEGFVQGQQVIDKYTGKKYIMKTIKMRGDGAVMAHLDSGDILPLGRFR